MRKHDAFVGMIRSTVVVVAIGFAWSSFAVAKEPANPPAPPPTVQDEKAPPADKGEVKERGVTAQYQLGFFPKPKPNVHPSKPPTGGTTKSSPSSGPIQ